MPPAPSPLPPLPETADAPTRTAHHRAAFQATDAAHQLRVHDVVLDTWLEFPCEPGETVLDAAERAGFELPYSCRSGGCLSCAAKVLAGQTVQGDQYVLEDEHVAAGFRLLCCTTVTSDATLLSGQEDAVS
ncbi:MAG: 2Fe-2S iron-sulfur cluster binding domain-containing protein [Oligoflexia bacterium]|nr:2Fe-2S iron-sulfur cluster binding domain-containing protein [Oligoflexia bacterium]